MAEREAQLWNGAEGFLGGALICLLVLGILRLAGHQHTGLAIAEIVWPLVGLPVLIGRIVLRSRRAAESAETPGSD